MKSLAFYTKRSLIFHAFIGFLFLTVGKLVSWHIQGKKHVRLKLIENSIRVDMVQMPKRTLQEIKKLPIVEQKIEDTIPIHNTQNVISPKSSKKNNLTEFLKGLSKGKIEKSPRRQAKRKKPKNRRELRALVLAGNKLSKGQSTFGKGTESIKNYEAYLESLADRVRRNWSLPGYFASTDLRCRIKIYLNRKGKLLRTQVFESSGNEEFDKAALEAVKRTSYPPPDDSFAKEVLQGRVILGFPL